MPNSYKEDLKLMLGKLTNMIGSNDSTNESILSNIYNDFDSLNPVDQFVVREYVSDCINEIVEAKKINTDSDTKAVEATTTILSANCRIVPGTDGKFSVYDEDKIVGSYDNEADARSFVNAQQKNTLVSADEEVMDENNEDEYEFVDLDDPSYKFVLHENMPKYLCHDINITCVETNNHVKYIILHTVYKENKETSFLFLKAPVITFIPSFL